MRFPTFVARVSSLAPLIVACAIAFPNDAVGQVAQASVSGADIERGIAIGRILVAVLHRARPARTPTSRRAPGGSSGAPSSGSSAASSNVRVSASAARTARRILASGEDLIGTPYVWGGSTPRGFDCSGFVQYIYREHGVTLPRTSRQMAHAGVRVPVHIASLVPGDLMLFSGATSTISHVAIYAGNGRILHSSSSGHGVGYDRLDDTKRGRYFVSHFVAARRVIENGASLVQSLSSIERLAPFDHFDPPDQAPPRQ